GARLAMTQALRSARIEPKDVGYVNLHGTASRKNDEVEAQLIAELFPPAALASSTKAWTGHALGAAGIVEAAVCLLALEQGFVPGTLNLQEPDPACGPQIIADNVVCVPRYAVNNSFGFGGSNCSLVFGHG
ncbi:MAG: beta-ketoacyl-[acyl-carrier-protein] synthase II, partial [Betaproteobacteria bacterium]|nr:beta-ketoacyl-[acyl-carrier-protein] synthase II [Betaproteobacteria bacterium]